MDLYSLLNSDEPTARAQAAELAAALRNQRSLGTLGMLTGDKALGGVGQQLGNDANRQEGELNDALQRRPATRRAAEEEAAWQHPTAGAALRGMLGQFMPDVPVDDSTPTPVLRNLVPIAEKFAQARQAGILRQALQNKYQQKFDQNTGEYYLLNPLDGSTYFMSGAPRTHGVLRPTPAVGGQPSAPPPQRAAPSPTVLPTSVGAPAPGAAAGPPAGAAGPAQSPPATPGQQLLSGRGAAPNKRADQEAQKMLQALDPMFARGGLKTYSDQINRAQKLDALLIDPATGAPRKLLTPQDMTETAIALQQLVAAGHASSTEVEHLVPKGLGSDAARALQYFTNTPWDAGQQEWASRMLHTASREAGVALNTVHQSQLGRVPSTVGLRQLQPQRWAAQMKQLGLNPDDFDEYGNLLDGRKGYAQDVLLQSEKAAAAGGHGGAPAVRKFTRVGGKLVEVK